MGKSSSQVVGYRYYAKFAAFIGNRIEKLIAINFDNRKWVIHDPLKHPPNLLPVLEGNLFGENEGGVSGNIDIHFGYPDPEPNAEYQKYFPLVSGYPYQSYLVFRGLTSTNLFTGKQTTAPGFYLGNSGYMKEMLLWPKRIHVRNDGREQWYDQKAEIGEYAQLEPGHSYGGLGAPISGVMSWTDPGGSYSRVIANHGFPFFDAEQSYGIGFSQNGPPLPEIPSFFAAQGILGDHGLSFKIDGGTVIPPVTSTSYPPTTDGFWNGAIVRNYSYNSVFNWSGGDFEYKGVLSENGASVEIFKINEDKTVTSVASIGDNAMGTGFYYTEGKTHLESGNYRLVVDTGTRYGPQGTPRPLICLLFKVKARPSNSGDINPIHKIREIFTDDTAMGKPESDINDFNFRKAADRIWNEGLGVSWAIDEKSCIEAIEELCYHIEAGIRINRQTGLYEMVLFRDDWFDEGEIHTITENKIKDLSLEVMNSDDIVNQLNVTYYDRERIKNSTFSVYENGSILTMGHANAESVEFPYFMNMRNAEIVANWKLKQFSTPAWSGSFTTGWREARKWNRYDLIRLPWSKKWNDTILVRIMKINLGDGVNNTVTIDFEEVIPYSGDMNTSIVVDTPVDTAPQPPQPSVNAVFEAPYYLTVLKSGQTSVDAELSNNPDIGYVVAIAAKPQSNSLNALLFTDGGAGEFEQVSRLDYCDILQLDQPVIETNSSFIVTGSLTQIANSNNLILLNDEFMGFVSFDDATKVLTVKRGVLDTVPKKHNSGSLFVFDLPDVAFDSTQYAQSEIVKAQVLTTTPSGIQELSAGTAIEVQSRAIRPYPPANVKINGEYYPNDEIAEDIQVSWVDRNRTQQTGGEILGFYDGGVTAESGVTYAYELFDSDTNTIIDSASNIISPLVIPKAVMSLNNKLELFSVRDGYESYERFTYDFTKSSIELWNPTYIQKTVWIDANDSVTDSGYLTSITDRSENSFVFTGSGDSRFAIQDNETIGSKCLVRSDSQYCFNALAGSALNRANHAWAFYVVKNDSTNATYSDAYLMKTQGSYYGDNFSIMRATGKLHSPQMFIRNYPNNLGVISSDYETDNNWSIVLVHHNFTTGVYTFYVNGVVVKTGLWATGVLSDANGMYIGSADGAFNFKMPLFMLGKTDVSGNAQKLIGWAAHKYNLTSVLPVDHPYKNEPPLV